MFHTSYETEVNASAEACNVEVDNMIHCLQTNPELLSEKYFAGLGMQEDTDKNAFYLKWKESSYSPEEQYSKLVLDVLVNEKPFLKLYSCGIHPLYKPCRFQLLQRLKQQLLQPCHLQR